jgi:uncharacterized protein
VPTSERHGGPARGGRGGRVAVFGLVLTLALLAPVAHDTGPDTTVDAAHAAVDAGPVVAGHVPPDLPRRPGTLTAELAVAVARVDAYWAVLGAPWVRGYRSPSLQPAPDGLYGRDTPTPVCAGRHLRLQAAAFCPDGAYVAFGRAFMSRGYVTLGRAWLYVVVAHEWGHAVQQHLPPADVDVFRELQADCLAGVALRHVGRDVPLRLGPDARVRVFGLVGARPGPPGAGGSAGFSGPPSVAVPSRPDEPLPGQHGTVAERVSAFADGWHGGTEACLAPPR